MSDGAATVVSEQLARNEPSDQPMPRATDAISKDRTTRCNLAVPRKRTDRKFATTIESASSPNGLFYSPQSGLFRRFRSSQAIR
jgi:hypothetical protein